jgi:DNA-binding NtrC family response regulator
LRVLDREGEYQRLGENKSRTSDLRLVAATNRSLDELKQDFRARFSARVELPPLSARKSDIPLLVTLLLNRIRQEDASLVERFADASQAGGLRFRIAPDLIDALVRHEAPDNARWLERVLRSALLSSTGAMLALTSTVREALELVGTDDENLPIEPKTFTRFDLQSELDRAGGSVTVAAKQLGMSRFALYRLLRKVGIG